MTQDTVCSAFAARARAPRASPGRPEQAEDVETISCARRRPWCLTSSPPLLPLLLLFHTAWSLLFLYRECLFWQHTHAVYTLSTIITGRRRRGPGES
jgi:hypothetical protein